MSRSQPPRETRFGPRQQPSVRGWSAPDRPRRLNRRPNRDPSAHDVWGKRGQSLVEMAVTLPILLLLALGVTDLGRAFYYREGVFNATRQAIRLAASPAFKSVGDSACAGNGSTPATLSTVLPPASGDPLYQLGSLVALESSTDGTPAGSSVAGATLTVTWHCSGGSAVTNQSSGGVTDPSNPASDSIQAAISFPIRLITPVVYVLTGPTMTLSASEIGRAEY